MADISPKATPQSETPQQQTLPMQYDVRIHSLRLDGNCRAHASVNINGCFAIRGVKVMESSKGLFVSMPSYRAGNGEYKDICFPVRRPVRSSTTLSSTPISRRSPRASRPGGRLRTLRSGRLRGLKCRCDLPHLRRTDLNNPVTTIFFQNIRRK